MLGFCFWMGGYLEEQTSIYWLGLVDMYAQYLLGRESEDRQSPAV